MGKWVEKWPVEYSPVSDENIDSFAQKYIAEINRIYNLMHRVRGNDATNGHPEDFTAYQWHVDTTTQILYMRNWKDEGQGGAWVEVGRFTQDGTKFILSYAVMNAGGCASIQIGPISERPETEVDNAVFVEPPYWTGQGNEREHHHGKTYRYKVATGAWETLFTNIETDENGKIIGDITGNAASADYAAAARTAGRASTADTATVAESAEKFLNSPTINGIPFDGQHNIRIPLSGGDVEDVELLTNLQSRTGQTERELANLQIKLADEGIFPDYNNLIVENFQNTDDVDEISVQVTSLAMGDDSMDVEDMTELKRGRTYTLTDGDQQEQVTIADMVREQGVNRIVLTAPTTKVYQNMPRLIRTTAGISDGVVYGAGARSNVTWRPAITWSGEVGSTTITLMLDSSTANAAAFELYDKAAFTANGEMTIGGN